MKNSIIPIILLACFTLVANAQKFITLSVKEEKSRRDRIVIFEGNRVKCRFIDGSKIVGIIDKITDDSIQINGRKFSLEDIKSMAKRKKGGTAMIVGIQIVPALGGAISIAVGNLPVAVGCFALQIVGSLLFATPLHDYPLRNIKGKWVLDVQDITNQRVK
ncbi:MAG: hypothetical protein K2U26_11970 [Cyclobacteriaceae bacterium]|nr:hypothetical protein [Cyclobacteriaceae bacterium]